MLPTGKGAVGKNLPAAGHPSRHGRMTPPDRAPAASSAAFPPRKTLPCGGDADDHYRLRKVRRKITGLTQHDPTITIADLIPARS